jgi:hypothetical protein
METLEIISYGLTFLSTSVAVIQTIKKDRIKKIQKLHCENRCRNIVSLTREMTKEVYGVCKTLNGEILWLKLNSKKPDLNITQMAVNVGAVNALTGRLVNFCDEINREHESEFGYKIFSDLEKELPERECLITASDQLKMIIED